MNPSNKGWLNKYLDFRNSVDTHQEISKLHPGVLDSNRVEEGLYRILQPTGLIYGHPVQLPYLNYPKSNEWTPSGKMSVILVEGLINSAILPVLPDLAPEDVSEIAKESVMRSVDYYQAVYPEIFSSSLISGSKMDKMLKAEKLISSRLMYKVEPRNYWKTFFHNSLLFLDVYYFGKWFHQHDSVALEEVREKGLCLGAQQPG